MLPPPVQAPLFSITRATHGTKASPITATNFPILGKAGENDHENLGSSETCWLSAGKGLTRDMDTEGTHVFYVTIFCVEKRQTRVYYLRQHFSKIKASNNYDNPQVCPFEVKKSLLISEKVPAF